MGRETANIADRASAVVGCGSHAAPETHSCGSSAPSPRRRTRRRGSPSRGAASRRTWPLQSSRDAAKPGDQVAKKSAHATQDLVLEYRALPLPNLSAALIRCLQVCGSILSTSRLDKCRRWAADRGTTLGEPLEQSRHQLFVRQEARNVRRVALASVDHVAGACDVQGHRLVHRPAAGLGVKARATHEHSHHHT